MLKRGDKGLAVVAVQTHLLELGYPLPRWGADGSLGEETLVAMADFLADHSRSVDPDRNTISPDEIALLKSVHAGERPMITPAPPDLLFDLREKANRRNDRGPRKWSQITGVTLHQTACLLAENPQRMLNVGAHLVTGQKGQLWWLHGFDRIVWHGNGWNSSCVGIEMNGLFPGLKGQMSTVWDDPSTARREQPNPVTNELVEVTKNAVRWICGEVARHGGRVTHLVAHRQSSTSRQNDPGQEPWERVALPLMSELGLTSGPVGHKIGAGRAIPEQWDPRAKGIKY